MQRATCSPSLLSRTIGTHFLPTVGLSLDRVSIATERMQVWSGCLLLTGDLLCPYCCLSSLPFCCSILVSEQFLLLVVVVVAVLLLMLLLSVMMLLMMMALLREDGGD